MKSFLSRYWQIVLWLFLVVIALSLYTAYPGAVESFFVSETLEQRYWLMVGLYMLWLSVIGLFFIPSTPFALLGVFLFGPVEAYAYNLIGIITSTTIVYWFGGKIGLDRAIEERYPAQIQKIKQGIRSREIFLISCWSLVPFVPTDAIIYAVRSMKVPYWKCVTGVFIGEGILNFFYILLAAGAISFFGS